MAARQSALTACFVLIAELSMLGCNATSKAMRPTSHADIVGARDAATVVFVRPSNYKAESRTTILDDHGRFLGDSLAASYFVVRVPPGENVFISMAANTAALRANLAPGKIYFVEVACKPGFLHTRFHLLAIHARAPSWRSLDGWMTESAAYAPDEPAGQSLLSRAEDVSELIRRGHELLREYSRDELRARTLGPGDGL